MKKLISIGILAHNEENSIWTMLASLSKQSIFDFNTFKSHNPTLDNYPDLEIELIIVPNGCSDSTTKVASDFITSHPTFTQRLNNIRVEPLAQPGKAHAWNYFIHKISNPIADYHCLLDADIDLDININTLGLLYLELEKNPEIHVVLDKPIKDVQLKSNPTLLERLSLAVSKSSNEGQLYICGQLYMARGEVLRKIVMPQGLPVEDGYLTEAIISDNFTVKNKLFSRRIRRVSKASHTFEAITDPIKLIKHEVRVTTGIIINSWLFSNYYKVGVPCLFFLQSAWYLDKFVADEVEIRTEKQGQFWLIPSDLFVRRFTSLLKHSILKRFLLAPIALIAFFVDLIIFVQVDRLLKNKKTTPSKIW